MKELYSKKFLLKKTNWFWYFAFGEVYIFAGDHTREQLKLGISYWNKQYNVIFYIKGKEHEENLVLKELGNDNV